MLTAIFNILFLRPLRARWAARSFVRALESELAEEFLELLLRLMGLIFWLDADFRRQIEGFDGRYLFRSQDGQITVAAVFGKNRLKVCEREISDTDISVVFRDGKALMGFLLSPKPDILNALLRQDVRLDGNLNFIYKFAYMAKHLQLKLLGAA